MPQYHVACSRPGLHRGGRENPAFASYNLGDHTPEQLQALLDEPAITVVVGMLLTAEHIDNMPAAHSENGVEQIAQADQSLFSASLQAATGALAQGAKAPKPAKG